MKLLIIHPEGNIKNNPNLYYFCKELVLRGFKITIYSRLCPEIYQGELFEGADFKYFTANRIENFNVKKSLIKERFDYVLGIDEGLVEAEVLASAMGVAYAFLSYEIFFDNELLQLNNATDMKNKKNTVNACREIQFAIVQDEVRRKYLSIEYQISENKILLMPVAGSGVKRLAKTNYFHNRLNIPAEKKVLFYMGWMDDIQLKRLCSYLAFIPENWVLVIHSRYKYKGIVPENFNEQKIYFSLDTPIENMDDMGVLLSAVDAGFCSYEPSYKTPFTGDNVKYIGLSSGKASTFLQYGVPIVTENMNIWEELVPENNLGIVLHNQSDLNLLDTIITDESKSIASSFFEHNLDLLNFIDPILSNIQKGLDLKIKKNVLPFYRRELLLALKYLLKKIK